jgi:cell shape-determining protein MreC
MAQQSLENARVLEFNPKLRLVVLDVGSLQGARVGMPFIVVRGERVIAWARVVEVRQKICGALIEKTEGNVPVKTGDSASVTKS